METTISETVASAPPRALALRLLSAGFAYPDAAWRADFPAQLAAARLEGALEEGDAKGIEDALAEEVELLEEAHFRLFGPAPACPLDLAHHLAKDEFQQARRLADIGGFYKAFGVEPPGRPDSLPAVLEFMAYLELKLQRAREKGWEERAAVTRSALAKFRREAAAPALAAFVKRLENRGAPAFYRRLAAQCVRLGGSL